MMNILLLEYIIDRIAISKKGYRDKMHVISGYCGLEELNNNREKHFIDLYEKTPDKFMEEYGSDYSVEDLRNKYVISVESRVRKPRVIEDGKYCVNILDIYTPREGQKATLNYCGHIAFVDVTNEKDERIVLLYKDDECYPQLFNEWYDYFIEHENEEWSNGMIPTKEQILDIVKVMIKGYCQDPNLEIDINENNVIVLQGL